MAIRKRTLTLALAFLLGLPVPPAVPCLQEPVGAPELGFDPDNDPCLADCPKVASGASDPKCIEECQARWVKAREAAGSRWGGPRGGRKGKEPEPAWLGPTGPATPKPGREGPAARAAGHIADFDALWNFVRDRYCFLGEKATDWEAVRAHYRPLAAEAGERELIRVLEAALDELYDPHTHLGVNLADSWRLPPFDLWAEWRDGRAVVMEVRAGSPAAGEGVQAGDEVLSIDEKPVEEAAAARRPRFLRHEDPAALEWALLSALAGRHDRPRRLVLRSADGSPRAVTLNDHVVAPSLPVVSDRSIEGVGYIRIASFASQEAVAAFDAALARQRRLPALILDVRDNDGGDTAVARPIMGRLVGGRRQYAWMARREGKGLGPRWPESVTPRGQWTYAGRLVVLVNHWSQSMAEGFAMGLDGMGRAVIVGTRMAGLGAGVARLTLPRSSIPVQISAEPVYHVNGTPRASLRPTVKVDLSRAAGKDAILEAGLAGLRERAEAR